MNSMTRQRVVITGGSGALGAAVAKAFLAEGHKVALVDRGQAQLRPETGAPAFGGFDLADAGAARSAFEAAAGAMGGADVLVNVAGAFTFQMLAEADPAVWDRMFAANLKTCANMCRAALGRLAAGGAIVNVGAAAADRAGPGMAPYAASKAAVARLTESLAAELGGRIRVNAVLPLILDTPQNRAAMPDADPAGWTTPEAVADVIVFLASDRSRAINGALVPVTNPSRR